MKNLLEKAEVKVQEEIKRVGFIDDSDNTDRFLDNLSRELAKEEVLKGNEDIEFYYEKEGEIKELQEDLLEEIKDKIMSKYNRFFTVYESGHYKGCYYEIDKEFNNWDEFNDHFGIGE
jgi:hypothetical protein